MKDNAYFSQIQQTRKKDIDVTLFKKTKTISTELSPHIIELQGDLDKKEKIINAKITNLLQDIEVGFSSKIIYAFSPIAKIEKISESSYLITITDKNGTTTATVPVVSEETINDIIIDYFRTHPISYLAIREHNNSINAHEDIRLLIENLSLEIPKNISELENDMGYIRNSKELILEYDSFYDFPNIPSDSEKNMIFYDKSTGDMYLFGLNNDFTYTSIGLSSQDIIFCGNASSN